MKKYIIIFVVLLFTNIKVYAQIIIGSDQGPITGGALLELKERESTDTDLSTANKGFSNARVALSKNNELYPMYSVGYPGVADIAAEKRKHIGLMVYNVTSNGVETPTLDVFVLGLYIWDGSFWVLLRSEPVLSANIDKLLCETATLTPATYTADVAYTGQLKVPYLGGNGANYDASTLINTDIVHESNGLTFTLQYGKLNVGGGDIYYMVSGTPTESSPTSVVVPIKFLGRKCTVVAGNIQEVKSISFTKTVAENFDTSNIADKTFTTLGNLSVRVEYVQTGSSTYSYFLSYQVGIPNHVTILYTKSGAEVGYKVTGRKAAQDINAWYRVKSNATYGDGALIFDESASGGPTGNNDDLNPPNRDVIESIFMLHNTNEVYRVTINANGAIGASGGIEVVPSTVTVFLEKLD